MSLNKKTMVREIGRRTRLSNRDVERVIETLVEVWTEELVNGGRIEIEHFMVIATNHRRRVCVRAARSLNDQVQNSLDPKIRN